MSSKKRRVTVTLDGELVDLHKLKSTVPLSTDLNNYLQESLLCADELEEVNNQMERLQKKWNMLKSKQARLEQIKMMNVKNKNDVAACYDTLVHMEEANDGCIGKNQLHNLAEVKKLDFDDLYEFCMEKDFNIVEVAEPDVKKGARIRGMF